jgi:hypothetical protein
MTNPFGMTQLQQGAAQVHEMFVAYVNAGFTRDEALRIVIAMVANAAPQDPPKEQQ